MVWDADVESEDETVEEDCDDEIFGSTNGTSAPVREESVDTIEVGELIADAADDKDDAAKGKVDEGCRAFKAVFAAATAVAVAAASDEEDEEGSIKPADASGGSAGDWGEVEGDDKDDGCGRNE